MNEYTGIEGSMQMHAAQQVAVAGGATFKDLGLTDPVKRALEEMKFQNPTEVQEKAIPLLLGGADLIAQSKTGTGKTAAFGIPIVEKCTLDRKVQVLVLTPTRELAVQVSNDLHKMSKYKGHRTVTVYGGASMNVQIDAIRRGAQIVVGTPGRVIDHLKRGTLRLDAVAFVVLDEADRMLDMGFIDDVRFILQHTPKQRQTVLFSATMPEEIVRLTHQFMRAPKHLKLSEDSLTVDKIEQKYYDVENIDKFYLLTRVLGERGQKMTIVFRRTQRNVDQLVEKLQAKKVQCEAIHGGLRQGKREQVLKLFRAGKIHVLVATDVAARGLDIKGVEHVINYDMPEDFKSYVHRIGRTGRIGGDGEAISFITREDHRVLREIMMESKTKVQKLKFPGEKRDRGMEYLNWDDMY